MLSLLDTIIGMILSVNWIMFGFVMEELVVLLLLVIMERELLLFPSQEEEELFDMILQRNCYQPGWRIRKELRETQSFQDQLHRKCQC